MRVWGKVKIEDSIKEDVIVTAEDFNAALLEVCEHFDLTKPILVHKHYAEIEKFNRTIFYPDDFIEVVSFDTLELEIIVDKKKNQK